eukprot:COSAG01_NODE_54486_length_331_cov_6.150862_1_plen_47_part_10
MLEKLEHTEQSNNMFAEWMHRQHAPESAYCGRASPEDTIPDDAITSD